MRATFDLGQGGQGGGGHGGVLGFHQLLGFGRPGQQLGIEADPVGVEFLPETGRVQGIAQAGEEGGFEGGIGEEVAAGAGVHLADALAREAQAALDGGFVAAQHHHHAAAHVLFFAHHALHAEALVVVEGFGGVFEQVGQGRIFGGRHGGRQVQQPLGVQGETAHHLQGGHGVFLTDGHALHEAGFDELLAGHVADVEDLVGFLLQAPGSQTFNNATFESKQLAVLGWLTCNSL